MEYTHTHVSDEFTDNRVELMPCTTASIKLHGRESSSIIKLSPGSWNGELLTIVVTRTARIVKPIRQSVTVMFNNLGVCGIGFMDLSKHGSCRLMWVDDEWIPIC